MRRYLDDWIPQWTSKDGDSYPHTLTSGLGDWVAPAGIPTLNALTTTRLLRPPRSHRRGRGARAREAADAPRYDALFEKVRSDFNARFLSETACTARRPVEPFVHTAQILPLAFGLVPDDRRVALAARLADDIRDRSGNACVGVLGARYVLPVLTATGHHDVAFTVATQTDEPSWGYWTDRPFTALGEHWTADTRSRNHHFFGAIVQWFYEDLAGIRPLEPGYERSSSGPRSPRRASTPSPRPTRACAEPSRRAGDGPADGLELDVTVPPNATGASSSAPPEDVTERARATRARRSAVRHARGRRGRSRRLRRRVRSLPVPRRALPVLSRDEHFDVVPDLDRESW